MAKDEFLTDDDFAKWETEKKSNIPTIDDETKERLAAETEAYKARVAAGETTALPASNIIDIEEQVEDSEIDMAKVREELKTQRGIGERK
jgi:hypothetical protein